MQPLYDSASLSRHCEDILSHSSLQYCFSLLKFVDTVFFFQKSFKVPLQHLKQVEAWTLTEVNAIP